MSETVNPSAESELEILANEMPASIRMFVLSALTKMQFPLLPLASDLIFNATYRLYNFIALIASVCQIPYFIKKAACGRF